MLVLINNKFATNPSLPLESNSFRGYGVFETLKFENEQFFKAKDHIKRLKKSAKKIEIGIKYTEEEIFKMLQKIAKKSPHKKQRIKIIVIPKKIILLSSKLKIDKKIYQGVSCMSIEAKRELPEIKSISYLTSFLANTKAQKKGYFDAILTKNNEVYECAYANLFWFEKNTLYTRKKDILPGITRKTILEISPYPVKFENIKIQELKKKKEVFLTSSIKGIVPITKIDKTIISKKPGEKTQNLTKIFKKFSTKAQ